MTGYMREFVGWKGSMMVKLEVFPCPLRVSLEEKTGRALGPSLKLWKFVCRLFTGDLYTCLIFFVVYNDSHIINAL